MTGQKILGSLSECCPYVIIRLVNIVVYNLSFICQNFIYNSNKILSLSKNLFFLFFLEFLHIVEFHLKGEDFSFILLFVCFCFCNVFTFMWEWLICTYHFSQRGDKWKWPFRQVCKQTAFFLLIELWKDCAWGGTFIFLLIVGGLCSGVLFPLDKEVPWLVTFHESTKGKCKMCNVVFSIWCCFC